MSRFLNFLKVPQKSAPKRDIVRGFFLGAWGFGKFRGFNPEKCEVTDRFFRPPDRGSLLIQKVPKLVSEKRSKTTHKCKKKLKSISWTTPSQTKTPKPSSTWWGFLGVLQGRRLQGRRL